MCDDEWDHRMRLEGERFTNAFRMPVKDGRWKPDTDAGEGWPVETRYGNEQLSCRHPKQTEEGEAKRLGGSRG